MAPAVVLLRGNQQDHVPLSLHGDQSGSIPPGMALPPSSGHSSQSLPPVPKELPKLTTCVPALVSDSVFWGAPKPKLSFLSSVPSCPVPTSCLCWSALLLSTYILLPSLPQRQMVCPWAFTEGEEVDILSPHHPLGALALHQGRGGQQGQERG